MDRPTMIEAPGSWAFLDSLAERNWLEIGLLVFVLLGFRWAFVERRPSRWTGRLRGGRSGDPKWVEPPARDKDAGRWEPERPAEEAETPVEPAPAADRAAWLRRLRESRRRGE